MTGPLTPEALRRATRTWWEERCAQARADVNAFMEMAFRNDQSPTPEPMRQQWFHREWQWAWSTQPIVVIHGMTGCGKTEQIIGHLLWRIGRKPDIRILIVGNSENKAKELSAKLKRHIEENEIVRSIFPHLRPGQPWGVESFRVAGAGIDTTTNTVTIYGIDKPKAGPRADIVLLDDVNDEENTRGEDRRNNTIRTVDSVLQTRLTTMGQMFMLANAWHPNDLAFTYSRRPGIWYRAYPAWNANEELLWPEFRPRSWLMAKLDTMGPTPFARMFLCQPRDESTRIFKGDWFVRARKRGEGLRPVREVRHQFGRDGELRDLDAMLNIGAAMQSRVRIVVGVDLATGKTEKKRKTDFTVLFVVALHPNGDRQVLWVERGRWAAPETLERMKEIDERYQPDSFVVEDNGAQVFLAQFAGQDESGIGARIVPFQTGSAKWDESLGIEGIGVEMQAGRWILPAPAAGESEDAYRARLTPPELEAYVLIEQARSHLLDFSRTGHTPDDVMAWYFAKEGVIRLVTGTFSHRNAGEMAAPPPEEWGRALAGNAGTASALFAPPSPFDTPPAAAAPAPTPEPPPAAIPEHIRKAFSFP